MTNGDERINRTVGLELLRTVPNVPLNLRNRTCISFLRRMSPFTVFLIVASFAAAAQARVLTFDIPNSGNYSLRSKEIVHFINNVARTTWRAELSSRFKDEASAKRVLGLRKLPSWVKKPQLGKPSEEGRDRIPDRFDAREAWPNCPTIREIRDQSECGSCWAMGAVEAFSDRICIHSKGEHTPHLSAFGLLSCCRNCGWGCEGGFMDSSWAYFYWRGVVTGGPYGSNQGCMPYPFRKCEHHMKGGPYVQCDSLPMYKAPQCTYKCTNTNYSIPYSKDKYQTKSYYPIAGDPWRIQTEIMNNGPIEAGFIVYEDFLHYKSGIYQYKYGKPVGGHAIRIIGWGVENEVPYWLIANSWNKSWGEKGLFRMLRGVDECELETSTYAGVPRAIIPRL